MKRIVVGILGLLGLASAAAAERYEASTGFDASQVKPFLELLNRELSLGFELPAISDFITETPLEQERAKTLIVTFKGAQVELEVRAFMDDIESPDVYFYTGDKELSDAINTWLHRFLEHTGS